MTIFEFLNYKEYVQKWVEKQPHRGYGIYTKMADFLGLSAVMVSQIFKNDKNLSPEHALLLTEFLSLSIQEKDYFLLLIAFERAGSQKLRDYYKEQIRKIQKEKTESVKEVAEQDVTLSEADKAIFYSNWLYSAVRLATGIESYHSPVQIAERLGISPQETSDILDYLVGRGLCIHSGKGYAMGPRRTHLEAGSPYIKTRQISWRVKAFEKMDARKESNLFYTAPMSISDNQYFELRKKIMELISEFTKNLLTEDPHRLACMNIDLFDL